MSSENSLPKVNETMDFQEKYTNLGTDLTDGSFSKQEPSNEHVMETTEETIIPNSPNWVRYLNIFLLGFGFFLLFSAFNTSQVFMTSIFRDKGYIILGIIYGIFSLSNFLSPSIDTKLGSRLTIIISSITYVLFVFSMATRLWYLVSFFSFVIGFGAACLWTSQGVFMTLISEKDIGLFAGIFFGFFWTSNIAGSLIGSLFVSLKISYWIMFLLLGCFGIGGVVIFCILRPYVPIEKSPPKIPMKESLKRSFKILIEIKMILLIPMIFNIGFLQGIYSGKIPETVGIILGPKWIGYISSIIGVSEIIGSLVVGKLCDKIGNKIMMICSCILTFFMCGSVILIQMWIPYMFIASNILVGLSDSFLNTTTYSVIASLYREETPFAFGTMMLIKSLGTCTNLVVSIFLDLKTLEYIGFILTFISFISFLILDIFVKNPNKEK